jgi:endonuclease/exonuclease/phosphatase family metal-dependent hydrolase
VLVRSWNVFHGNASPPRRAAYLERMVRLASADRPDVLLLQEVPVWALRRLGAWTGMQVFGDVAARPGLGPIPWTAESGRIVTDLHHGRLRSVLTGQANAILLTPGAQALTRRRIVLNPRSFRKAQVRWLGIDPIARLAWAKERRICHAVRAELDGRTLLVAGLHATSYPADKRLPDAELRRAAMFADELAKPGDICVLGGDFNVTAAESRTLADLVGDRWGFSAPGPVIDHVLVRGAQAGPQQTWPEERRTVDGVLLSDHAPVEVEIT